MVHFCPTVWQFFLYPLELLRVRGPIHKQTPRAYRCNTRRHPVVCVMTSLSCFPSMQYLLSQVSAHSPTQPLAIRVRSWRVAIEFMQLGHQTPSCTLVQVAKVCKVVVPSCATCKVIQLSPSASVVHMFYGSSLQRTPLFSLLVPQFLTT